MGCCNGKKDPGIQSIVPISRGDALKKQQDQVAGGDVKVHESTGHLEQQAAEKADIVVGLPTAKPKTLEHCLQLLKGQQCKRLNLTSFGDVDDDESDDENETKKVKIDIVAVSECLVHNNTLIELYLGSNGLTSGDLKSLCPALQTNTSLTRLSLFDNKIGRDGAQLLAESLKSNPASKLTYLDLSYNRAGNQGVTALSGLLLAQRGAKIEVLNLNNNRIKDKGIEALAEAIPSARNIQVLSLTGNNKFSAEAGTLLANAVELNTSLESVPLMQTNIKPADNARIRAALTRNKNNKEGITQK